MDCIISPFPPTCSFTPTNILRHMHQTCTQKFWPHFLALCVAHMHKNASGSIFSPHYLHLLLCRVYFKMCLRLFFSSCVSRFVSDMLVESVI